MQAAFGCSNRFSLSLLSSKWYTIKWFAPTLSKLKAEKKSDDATRLCYNCDRNLKYDMYHRPTIHGVNVTTKDNYDIVPITKPKTQFEHQPCWTCRQFVIPIKRSERLSISFSLTCPIERSAHFGNSMSIRCDLLLHTLSGTIFNEYIYWKFSVGALFNCTFVQFIDVFYMSVSQAAHTN